MDIGTPKRQYTISPVERVAAVARSEVADALIRA